MKKLLRHFTPDPRQLALQLDFFASPASTRSVDQPAPPLRLQPGLQPRGDVASLAPFSQIAPAPGKRRLHIREHVLDYSLCRSKRRSIGFLIDDDGLRVTAPRWVTVAEIESAVREKERWIFAKLAERHERSAKLRPPMNWHDGATLPYLGGEVKLRISHQQMDGVRFDAERLELTLSLPTDASEQRIKDQVLGWLQREAKQLFAQRLPMYAEKLGVQYQSFALSSAMTQWGSCTHDGRIRLNWRLMHFALPQIDYVIAHELAHLREMNHGPRFWAVVQSVFPEFESARKALRERGPETLPIF